MPREKLQDANDLAAISLQIRQHSKEQQAASGGFPAPVLWKQHAAKPAGPSKVRCADRRPARQKQASSHTPGTTAVPTRQAAAPTGKTSGESSDGTSSSSESDEEMQDAQRRSIESADGLQSAQQSSSDSDADTTGSLEGEGAAADRPRKDGVTTVQLSNGPGSSTAFRSWYLEQFTSAFGDELQAFREADSGKSVVHTDLVLHAINATADAFPAEQQRLCLQDAQLALRSGDRTVVTASPSDCCSDWL